jgi:hypothetical protein
MPPFPPCETTGLINLCAPAPIYNWPSWFFIQLPNLIWYGVVALLLIAGMLLPFPSREVDTTGYDVAEGE